MNIGELRRKTIDELQEIAAELDIAGSGRLRKKELILQILKAETEKEGLTMTEGILEVLPDGYGFLRVDSFTPGPNDVYVSPSQIRRFNLRTGMPSSAKFAPKDNERYNALLRVLAVNMADAELAITRPDFDDLTPSIPMNASIWNLTQRNCYSPH